MNVEPTIGLAFLAGLVSFISPCVLPLIPAYVSYLGGRATAAAVNEERNRLGTFIHGIFFVLGFTLFFVGFGLLTAAAADQLTKLGIDIPTILTRLGGVAVILFGLYVMKALDPVFLRGSRWANHLKTQPAQALIFSLLSAALLLAYFFWVFENILLAALALMLLLLCFHKALRTATSLGDFWTKAIQTVQFALISDTRNLEIKQGNTTYLSSLGLGIVFSAGWTPCIGPIYGSVLTLASDAATDGGSLLSPALMLTAYSLGLGIPFLAAALAFNQMSGVMRSLKRNMRKVEYASGALLITMGVLILSGSLASLSRRFGSSGDLGDLSVRLEDCTIGASNGRIQISSWGTCIKDGMPKLKDRIVFASTKTILLNEISSNETPTLLAPLASPSESVPIGLKVGTRAPDFTTVTLDGENISLSDFKGQVVLLNFWATWCGPCQAEMPEFQTIYDEFKDQGFTVLAVDFLESPEAVQTFADEWQLNFPLAMDESGQINDLYRIGQYPTSFVIDGQGVIVEVRAGPLRGEELLAILDSLSAGG